MAKKECPSCAMDVDKKHKECPVCGHEFQSFSVWMQVVAVLLLMLFVLYFIVF